VPKAAPKPRALKAEDLMPMTCAQAWAAAGKQYAAMYDIVATLATVTLANRDLTFPNTKEAGIDAGTGIAKDCEADPQDLLFGIVDRHVRRVAQAAKAEGPSSAARPAMVTGTVAYRERIALPPSAVVKVQLVDVSRADAKAVVLGEHVIEAKGRQVPFAFEIPYDPAKIEVNHSYAVQARIEDAGQLRFISDQRYAVITNGAPTKVDLLLKAVGGSAPK
jgi:putative lipoprotein